MDLLSNTDDYSDEIFIGDMVLVAWERYIKDTGKIHLRVSRAYREDMSLEVTKLETSGGFIDCLVKTPDGTKTWIEEKYLHKIYGGT